MAINCLQPAVFLDKDGTLLRDVPYSADVRRMQWMPGAGAALRQLAGAGFALVVVTNQSGIALGYFSESALHDVRRRLEAMFAEEGVRLAGFFYCPHHPQASCARYARRCRCRKPRPGMLLEAAKRLRLDRRASWMLGDTLHDVEAGHRAGCRAILVDTGGETQWNIASPRRVPDRMVPDLPSAAEWILFSHWTTRRPRRGLSVRPVMEVVRG